MKNIPLELKHCKEVLSHELIIGYDSKINKRFTYHIWENEYRVYHNDKMIDCGQAVEELLEVYNLI